MLLIVRVTLKKLYTEDKTLEKATLILLHRYSTPVSEKTAAKSGSITPDT